ncbi:MAG: hypothetical protein Fur0043_28050 [Anaerolineales bacterium]
MLRDDDLPNVHRSYAAVLPHLPQNHKQLCLGKQGQTTQDYTWADHLAYADTQGRMHSLNLLEAWRNLILSAADLLRLGEGKFQIRFNSS